MQGEAKQIPLRRRGQGIVAYSLVDPEDFERFGDMRWHFQSDGYACHSLALGRTVFLHRAVMDMSSMNDGSQVDHINGDRIDNRRANLRVVTNAQNGQNVRSHADAKSTYRGVSWDVSRGMWRARVFHGRVELFQARFATEIEAAYAAEAYRLAHLPFATPDPRLTRP
jgi:hypothetical protein